MTTTVAPQTKEGATITVSPVYVNASARPSNGGSRGWPGKPLHVEITDEDVLRGKRGDPIACPVSFAVTRTLQALAEAGDDPLRWSLCCPIEVGVWIDAFDRGDEVGAFSFDTLEI